MQIRRVLVFVDEANVVSSVRALGRKLDWLLLRDHLADADEDGNSRDGRLRRYASQRQSAESQCEKKGEVLFIGFALMASCLRTKDGSPGDGKHYKANVDVLMAIDAVELSVEMRPEVVVLVTGDADFVHLALQLLMVRDSRRSGCNRANAGHWIEGCSKRGDRSGSPV